MVEASAILISVVPQTAWHSVLIDDAGLRAPMSEYLQHEPISRNCVLHNGCARLSQKLMIE